MTQFCTILFENMLLLVATSQKSKIKLAGSLKFGNFAPIFGYCLAAYQGLQLPGISGHNSCDWNFVNVIGAINEPFTREFR